MLTKSLCFICLLALISLMVIALPNFINSFSTNPSVTSIMMSGLVILLVLAGAVMLLLFGVLGVKGNVAKSNV